MYCLVNSFSLFNHTFQNCTNSLHHLWLYAILTCLLSSACWLISHFIHLFFFFSCYFNFKILVNISDSYKILSRCWKSVLRALFIIPSWLWSQDLQWQILTRGPTRRPHEKGSFHAPFGVNVSLCVKGNRQMHGRNCRTQMGVSAINSHWKTKGMDPQCWVKLKVRRER